MAKILNVILTIVVILLTLRGVGDVYSQVFVTCTLVVIIAIAVKLRRPIFGINLLTALLFFSVLKSVNVTWTLLSFSFAVPVFVTSFALEAVMSRYDAQRFTPAAAVAVAAMVVGRHGLGLDYISPYDGVGPIVGAVVALLVGQAMLVRVKEKLLVGLALPVVVVTTGWLVGSLWPVTPLLGFHQAIYELLGFFFPGFALPAVGAVAIFEAISKRRGQDTRSNKAV